jgi:enoyl-[acyl-carrier protein] reductase II
LALKKLTPVRLIKNKFYDEVAQAEARGASVEELSAILGRARAKKGMFEGDLDEGELEIGQGVTGISKIMPAAEIVKEIWSEYQQAKKQLCES